MVDEFHERFDIKVGLEQAKERFVNRLQNDIIEGLLLDNLEVETQFMLARKIASTLGIRYMGTYAHNIVGPRFLDNIRAVEVIYHYLSDHGAENLINPLIERALSLCEIDIGIVWNNGKFIPTGANLLDQHLVNDTLSWLRDKSYSTVLTPFEKGLSHLLHSQSHPELLADVVTDMYEALEALAGIVTGKPIKDLSANKELFISKVKASPEYRKLLTDYIDYANNFRHAAKESKPKPALSPRECESFVYLTGLFIRLAM